MSFLTAHLLVPMMGISTVEKTNKMQLACIFASIEPHRLASGRLFLRFFQKNSAIGRRSAAWQFLELHRKHLVTKVGVKCQMKRLMSSHLRLVTSLLFDALSCHYEVRVNKKAYQTDVYC